MSAYVGFRVQARRRTLWSRLQSSIVAAGATAKIRFHSADSSRTNLIQAELYSGVFHTPLIVFSGLNRFRLGAVHGSLATYIPDGQNRRLRLRNKAPARVHRAVTGTRRQRNARGRSPSPHPLALLTGREVDIGGFCVHLSLLGRAQKLCRVMNRPQKCG